MLSIPWINPQIFKMLIESGPKYKMKQKLHRKISTILSYGIDYYVKVLPEYSQ
jgi:hypothetical protein